MTEQETAFVAAINANPADLATRLVYADWLEEEGRTTEAAGHRWMAENGKVPEQLVWESHGNVWQFRESYFWWELPHRLPRMPLPMNFGTYPVGPTASAVLAGAAEMIGTCIADGVDLRSRDELADMDAYYAQLRETEPTT